MLVPNLSLASCGELTDSRQRCRLSLARQCGRSSDGSGVSMGGYGCGVGSGMVTVIEDAVCEFRGETKHVRVIAVGKYFLDKHFLFLCCCIVSHVCFMGSWVFGSVGNVHSEVGASGFGLLFCCCEHICCINNEWE